LLTRQSQETTIPNWDFNTDESGKEQKLAKKYNDTLKIGKSVAFEDEFEVPMLEYSETTPFGYDLLKTIVMPAFTAQRRDCSQSNRVLLDEMIEKLGLLALKEPVVAEQACRKMLEDLFASSRQSLKEFLATISKREGDDDDFVLDDLDTEKLSFHSQSGPKQTPIIEFRSKVAEYLLQRWLKR
jgi:hypothetical protein